MERVPSLTSSVLRDQKKTFFSWASCDINIDVRATTVTNRHNRRLRRTNLAPYFHVTPA